MHKTKECIMCFSEIDARAKKCPQCTSLQAKYSNLESNPVLIGFLGLLILGIFIYIFYESYYLRVLKDEALHDLTVTVTEVSTKKESNGLYVACIGNIHNQTEYKFRGIKFQIDLFSNKNELIDTFSIVDEDIDILSKTSTNFRVRGSF